MTKAKDDPLRRLVLPVKNNIAPDVMGLGYRITDLGDNRAVVAWEKDPIELTADDALAQDPRGGDDADGADVEGWLREVLTDGDTPSADILREGKRNGFPDKTIRKAFRRIGGTWRREGFGPGSTVIWFIPEPSIDSR